MSHHHPGFDGFQDLAKRGNLIPVYRRLFGDHLTPVLAYRRLVKPDARHAPSFLLESVVGGEQAARYSFLGAQPIGELVAYGHRVRHRSGGDVREYDCDDPLAEPARITASDRLSRPAGLPAFTGGWVGYAGYDTVRYTEGEKLRAEPEDDRGLPDLHLSLYRNIVAFDHAHKTILVVTHVHIDEHPSIRTAYDAGREELDELVRRLEEPGAALDAGDAPFTAPARPAARTNMSRERYEAIVEKAKAYIGAGDIFQVVLSQRFERESRADPFDVYRALRVINPSPYMFYLQAEGSILIGSSPEILCRVEDGVVTNRPLAGTRRRGADDAEDAKLESDLLSDPKERSEHIMLVDLGRNDVGRVAQPATVAVPQVMNVERYSHVMHISSTVTGRLREGLGCWDALRATLPVGTVSGAPKVRAMQIIDELEPTRRGPYAGAVGYADFAGNMDMAIALRTIVAIPMADGWRYDLQAGAGIVAESVPAREYDETVDKAGALGAAIDVAEAAFTGTPGSSTSRSDALDRPTTSRL